METRNNVGYYFILVILVSTYYSVHAQSNNMYECWGGCYNNCFIIRSGSTTTTQADSLACDYNCLTSCIPHSASDFNYYCQIGCSLKLCIPVSYDGARLESCFGECTHLCKGI